MREIRFRGLDFKGIWRYGTYYYGVVYPDSVRSHQIDDCNIDENTIGQFTGLKDKNGKEIYEGDILWTYEHGIGNLNREVIFDNGSFGVRHKHQLFTELRGWKKDYLEVIGNIHQNPELL